MVLKKIFQFFSVAVLKILIPSLVFSCFSSISQAQMDKLPDSELAMVTGTALVAFSVTDNVVRIGLDLSFLTHTEIDSMKLGYYAKEAEPGWDNDWTDLQIGAPGEELKVSGLYLEAVFDDIADGDNRVIESVRFGAENVTGSLNGDFNSFTGDVASIDVDGDSIEGDRIALGNTTMIFNETGFYLSVSQDKGYWFHWDEALVETTAP